MTEGILV